MINSRIDLTINREFSRPSVQDVANRLDWIFGALEKQRLKFRREGKYTLMSEGEYKQLAMMNYYFGLTMEDQTYDIMYATPNVVNKKDGYCARCGAKIKFPWELRREGCFGDLCPRCDDEMSKITVDRIPWRCKEANDSGRQSVYVELFDAR